MITSNRLVMWPVTIGGGGGGERVVFSLLPSLSSFAVSFAPSSEEDEEEDERRPFKDPMDLTRLDRTTFPWFVGSVGEGRLTLRGGWAGALCGVVVVVVGVNVVDDGGGDKRCFAANANPNELNGGLVLIIPHSPIAILSLWWFTTGVAGAPS